MAAERPQLVAFHEMRNRNAKSNATRCVNFEPTYNCMMDSFYSLETGLHVLSMPVVSACLNLYNINIKLYSHPCCQSNYYIQKWTFTNSKWTCDVPTVGVFQSPVGGVSDIPSWCVDGAYCHKSISMKHTWNIHPWHTTMQSEVSVHFLLMLIDCTWCLCFPFFAEMSEMLSSSHQMFTFTIYVLYKRVALLKFWPSLSDPCKRSWTPPA